MMYAPVAFKQKKKRFYHCIITNCSLCHLQYLSLEGNQICSIPGSVFISLPNLLWLDLRKNLIESLPPEIGLHRYCMQHFLKNKKIIDQSNVHVFIWTYLDNFDLTIYS